MRSCQHEAILCLTDGDWEVEWTFKHTDSNFTIIKKTSINRKSMKQEIQK